MSKPELNLKSPQKIIIKEVHTQKSDTKIENESIHKLKTELNDDFHSFTEDGSLVITKLMNDGEYLLFHGDLIYAKSDQLDEILQKNRLSINKPQKWRDGIIYFEIERNLPNKKIVLETLKYFESKTNIQFKPRGEQSDFVHFIRGQQNCYSSLGRIGGIQKIALSSLCGKREVVHEIMHTLGFLHEHNRSDRDDYVEIVWKNISPDHFVQFKKLGEGFSFIKDRPFDFDSIMLYSSSMFSLYPDQFSILKNNSDVIKSSYELLSPEDILRVNLAYPKK